MIETSRRDFFSLLFALEWMSKNTTESRALQVEFMRKVRDVGRRIPRPRAHVDECNSSRKTTGCQRVRSSHGVACIPHVFNSASNTRQGARVHFTLEPDRKKNRAIHRSGRFSHQSTSHFTMDSHHERESKIESDDAIEHFADDGVVDDDFDGSDDADESDGDVVRCSCEHGTF